MNNKYDFVSLLFSAFSSSPQEKGKKKSRYPRSFLPKMELPERGKKRKREISEPQNQYMTWQSDSVFVLICRTLLSFPLLLGC